MAFVSVLWMEKPALFIMVLILATVWTKWDELGRVTEGTIVFTDVEHDVVIEMTVKDKRATQRVTLLSLE